MAENSTLTKQTARHTARIDPPSANGSGYRLSTSVTGARGNRGRVTFHGSLAEAQAAADDRTKARKGDEWMEAQA